MENLEQHLLFQVFDNVFTVDVTSVKSIIKLPKVFEVPQAPPFVLGVINVEGEVLPLIDSGYKFNAKSISVHGQSQVIILSNQEENDNGVQTLAFLVSQVLDVRDIDPLDIQKLPTSKYDFDNRFVDGVHSIDEKFYMQVNVKNLFSKELSEIINVNSEA